MAELRVIDAPMTPFDEARAQIAEWEKAYPTAEHVVLVLDAPEEMLVTITGEPTKLGYAVGLCTLAAQVLVE